jgi:hypothetical protein
MPEITSIETVNIYVDEIKEYKNQLGEHWAYIGVLIIPVKHRLKAQKGLQADRESAHYDGEIHFTELRNFSYAYQHQEKTALAKKWLQRALHDTEKIFHFNLLGINLTNLQHNLFGRTARERRPAIYNRFLRAAILYPAQRFFAGQMVQIKYLFHDETELQRHDWFKRHIVKAINGSEAPIYFDAHRIQFINSDHRRESHFPRESHFVQLCDLLTGAMTQVLDNRTGKNGCNELAGDIYPLVERLIHPQGRNAAVNSPNPFDRWRVSFFPSRQLTAAQLEDPAMRNASTFYVARPLLWTPPESLM